MKREIKYRIWIVKEEKLVEWEDKEAYPWFMSAIEFYEYNDDVIMEQFTGRSDCKGNDVYDGDIFKDTCHTYTVHWDNNACGFKIKTIGSGKLIRPKYNNIEGVLKYLCVIGNIHQNKDLLI